MIQKYQHTLKKTYSFEGKGLHTGRHVHMTVSPAPADAGVKFVRTDMAGAPVIAALAENVSGTARSTTLSCGEASVSTVEHILSALSGMGVDNAVIGLDGPEVPILDGSALPYAEAFALGGLVAQDAPKRLMDIEKEIIVKDGKSGAFVRIEPAARPAVDLTVDFGSRVLGVQSAHWTPDTEYATELAPCRTFAFFHEIEHLAGMGLVKGGDVDNAVIVVEHPVSEEQVSSLCRTLGVPEMSLTGDGYLCRGGLRYADECGRHKLLDLIGDLSLCGGWLNARVTAYKPGHAINTEAARAVRKALNLK